MQGLEKGHMGKMEEDPNALSKEDLEVYGCYETPDGEPFIELAYGLLPRRKDGRPTESASNRKFNERGVIYKDEIKRPIGKTPTGVLVETNFQGFPVTLLDIQARYLGFNPEDYQ